MTRDLRAQRPHRLATDLLPQPGTQLGRYVLQRQLGVGGMGAVYLAQDLRMQRRVALKIPKATGSRTGPQRRLAREAQALSGLVYPSIPRLLEVGIEDGHMYLATNFISGHTVSQWRSAPRPPSRVVVAFMIDIARALAVVHDAGLVHRDVKPSNLMYDAGGGAWLIDFGLARSPRSPAGTAVPDALMSPSRRASITCAGDLVGTPAYMAPEQLERGEFSTASDQFSFFVTLHELLIGERPFEGNTSAEIATAIRQGSRRPWPEDTRLPPGLIRTIDQGLSAAPEDRLPCMRAAARSLATALPGLLFDA